MQSRGEGSSLVHYLPITSACHILSELCPEDVRRASYRLHEDTFDENKLRIKFRCPAGDPQAIAFEPWCKQDIGAASYRKRSTETPSVPECLKKSLDTRRRAEGWPDMNCWSLRRRLWCNPFAYHANLIPCEVSRHLEGLCQEAAWLASGSRFEGSSDGADPTRR